MNSETEHIIAELRSLGNPTAVSGMQRFGIETSRALGIKIPVLRQLAKTIGRNHPLAIELWQTDMHEARLLAIFIADHKQLNEELMESWLKDFNSWDVCDQACSNLFIKHPEAYKKAALWSKRQPEFEKRAGFTMMAALAIHDKKASNDRFEAFFNIIIRESGDPRNFVYKAVNWALRQIGKRNIELAETALSTCEKIRALKTGKSSWIAADAEKELRSKWDL